MATVQHHNKPSEQTDFDAEQGITLRQAHWAGVAKVLGERHATNGIGHAVHALLPAGWTQTGITRETQNEAYADLACCPCNGTEELNVCEVLTAREVAL